MMWFPGSRKNSLAQAENAEFGSLGAEVNEGKIANPADIPPTDNAVSMSGDVEIQQPIANQIPPAAPIESLNTSNAKARPEYRPSSHQRCGGVALALGGGVARGWAHIGVLRAVEEFGLPVTMVAGTSIGALVGGSYLAGKLDNLEKFARSLTKSNIVRYLDFTLRGSGLITGSRLARRMEEHMDDLMIEDMEKPFVAVATEIQSGHEVWLSDGPIVPAIRASYALPGVFSPVMHGGRQLVDGALVNPVPVSVCRAYEPDIVIAVNLNAETYGKGTVIRPSHYDEGQSEQEFLDNAGNSSWLPFLSNKDKKSTRENRLGVTAIMVESFNIIQDRIARARLAGDPPDFTIRPKLKNVGLIEFHKADEAIRLGYDEMMIRLKELEEQGVLERVQRAL